MSVSSAGKTFSVTGWKIGWLTAPETLRSAVQTAKQFLTYVNGAPFQYAIADALALPDRYFAELRLDLMRKRDLLTTGLKSLGLNVFPTAGSYFLNTDVSIFDGVDSLTFCRDLPGLCGVVAIPTSVFFDTKELGSSLVRWAFCKQESVLSDAITRLQRLVEP